MVLSRTESEVRLRTDEGGPTLQRVSRRRCDEVTFAAGPIEPGVGDRITAQAMAALNKERFAELVAEGRKLDQAAVLALARKIG